MPLITPPSLEFSDWADRALCTPGSIIHTPNPFVFFPCWGWFLFYFRYLYLTLLTPLVCSMYPIYHSLAPPYLCLLIFGLVMVFTSCTSISNNPAPSPLINTSHLLHVPPINHSYTLIFCFPLSPCLIKLFAFIYLFVYLFIYFYYYYLFIFVIYLSLLFF